MCYVDCLDTDKPQLLYPEVNRTETEITLSGSLEFACIALVGPAPSCDGQQCAVGWRRTVNGRTVNVSDSVTERVHSISETA